MNGRIALADIRMNDSAQVTWSLWARNLLDNTYIYRRSERELVAGVQLRCERRAGVDQLWRHPGRLCQFQSAAHFRRGSQRRVLILGPRPTGRGADQGTTAWA